MARGQQKIQSQQKNAEKRAKQKKGTSQIKSAEKALVFSCTVCMSKMPDPKTYKQHFESKHPKSPLPDALKSSWKASNWCSVEDTQNSLIKAWKLPHLYSLQICTMKRLPWLQLVITLSLYSDNCSYAFVS